jgi:uncharacterized repeat protein (TIGR04138 family)
VKDPGGVSDVLQVAPEERALLEILERDPRYALGAYEFTRLAVTYASEVVFATGTHVTGRELLEAIRQFARERYGVMAPEVLRAWGVHTTDDFGEIVFNLVDQKLLSKTDEDSKEDFREVYSFDEAFDTASYWRELLESR